MLTFFSVSNKISPILITYFLDNEWWNIHLVCPKTAIGRKKRIRQKAIAKLFALHANAIVKPNFYRETFWPFTQYQILNWKVIWLLLSTCRVTTGPGKSWNLKIVLESPEKSWDLLIVLKNIGKVLKWDLAKLCKIVHKFLPCLFTCF